MTVESAGAAGVASSNRAIWFGGGRSVLAAPAGPPLIPPSLLDVLPDGLVGMMSLQWRPSLPG